MAIGFGKRDVFIAGPDAQITGHIGSMDFLVSGPQRFWFIAKPDKRGFRCRACAPSEYDSYRPSVVDVLDICNLLPL